MADQDRCFDASNYVPVTYWIAPRNHIALFLRVRAADCGFTSLDRPL